MNEPQQRNRALSPCPRSPALFWFCAFFALWWPVSAVHGQGTGSGYFGNFNIVASKGTQESAIEVSWDPQSWADSYAVYRSTLPNPTPGTIQLIAHLPGAAPPLLIDTRVHPGVTYYYWVSASYERSLWSRLRENDFGYAVLEAVGPGMADQLLAWGVDPERTDPFMTHGPLDLPNISAYAMGVNPFEASAEKLPQLVEYDPEKATFAFQFYRNTQKTGVRMLLETSEQLQAWGSPPPLRLSVVEEMGEGRELMEVEYESSAPQLFFRLNIAEE